MASAKFYGTGRRKKSIARVYLVPGTGKITINKRDIDEYFGLDTLKVIVRQPLAATETEGKFDVLVNVHGGGYTGQAGAIRHGVARALLQADNDYRPVLKAAGFLTRDPRMKERLDRTGTRYVRLFYDKNYESVLEGEITETGVGLVLRKKLDKLSELFIFKKKK